jgi:hypothetical protein
MCLPWFNVLSHGDVIIGVVCRYGQTPSALINIKALKYICLSEENMVSVLYLDRRSEQKLVCLEPAVWNILFCG